MSSDLSRLRVFNAVAVNNKFAYHKLVANGIDAVFLPDGVDFKLFNPVVPVADRPLRLLFVASKMKCEHKGGGLFRRLLRALDHLEIPGCPLIVDSRRNRRTHEEMAKIYNAFPIYVCLSQAEGGPATLLEASACGCVPVTTPVGYSRDLLADGGGFIVERCVSALEQKISEIHDNQDMLTAASIDVQRAVKSWDWACRAKSHEKFLLGRLQ